MKTDRNRPIDKIDISKKYIEEKITQEELWKYYLGGFDVENWIDTRDNFKSELRLDNTPTCSLYTKNGNIYYKDWAGHFQGDVYNLVCYLNNLQYNDLMGAMKIIVRDFADRFYGANANQDAYILSVTEDVEREEKRQRKIQIKKMNWTFEMATYWKDYGFNGENLGGKLPSIFLAENDVYCPQYIWIDGVLRYSYSKADPAIAYFFGYGRYKIYFPLRTKGARFIGNSSAIQGYNQLPENGDLLIITKSMKDVLLLKMFGFAACALQSEQHHLEQEAFEHLSKRFKKIIVLYDNDEAGRNGAAKLKERYGLENVEIPEKYENCKDITDVSKDYGAQEAYQCIEDLIYEWL